MTPPGPGAGRSGAGAGGAGGRGPGGASGRGGGGAAGAGGRGPGPGEGRYAPRRLEDEPIRIGSRSAASPLKRMEVEEKEEARRRETVRVGWRLSFMGVVVLGLLGIIVFRLWSLQVLNSASAKRDVTADTTQSVPITPTRGLIEARDGQVLVANKVESVVTLSRTTAENDPKVVRRLAVLLDISVADIKADLDDDQNSIYAPVTVAADVSESTSVYILEHKSLFPGVSVSDQSELDYPYGDLASQTLGYISDISAYELKAWKGEGYEPGDLVGQIGLESEYDRYLRGTTGERELLIDNAGDAVGTKKVTAARPGDDVVTNLDLGLEQAATKDLQSQIDTLDASGEPASSGAVVVEDPRNGQILAMVSLPDYDPSWWVGGISIKRYDELTRSSADDPMLNRAISGEYTPGSTFKIATATAALDEGLVGPDTYVSDPGSFTIPNCSGGCTFDDDESEAAPGGSLNIVTAIAMSDDVFFYTMGYDFYVDPERYGDDPIQKYAAAYGLGQATDVDLPGAYTGQVDSPQLRTEQHKMNPKAYPYTYYGPGDALETAFGQGETVITPLELANAYSTFANGGTLYAPEVANEIISPSGKVVKKIEPKVIGHVNLPATTRETMLEGFEEEITNPLGTGYPTSQEMDYPYSEMPIAGKTGTSQVNPADSSDTDGLYVGFGPTSDPEYTIACIIPNAGYGDVAALPVVLKLFEYLIKHPATSANVAPSTPSGEG